jgi:MerR family transcriptional regulator, thiopeptide resistance regulator
MERDLARQSSALAALRATLGQVDEASAPPLDQLLENIAMTTQLDVQLTEHERQQLAAQRERLGEAAIAEAQQAWPRLIAEVRAAIAAGSAAESSDGQALARRWHALVQLATAGDAGIGRKIGAAFQAQPQAMAAMGMDAAMFDWVARGMAAAGLRWATRT